MTPRPNFWDVMARYFGRITNRQHEEIAGLRDEIKALREDLPVGRSAFRRPS